MADLIARLPEILADKGPRPAAANARMPEILAPSMSITWSRGAERLIARTDERPVAGRGFLTVDPHP